MQARVHACRDCIVLELAFMLAAPRGAPSAPFTQIVSHAYSGRVVAAAGMRAPPPPASMATVLAPVPGCYSQAVKDSPMLSCGRSVCTRLHSTVHAARVDSSVPQSPALSQAQPTRWRCERECRTLQCASTSGYVECWPGRQCWCA